MNAMMRKTPVSLLVVLLLSVWFSSPIASAVPGSDFDSIGETEVIYRGSKELLFNPERGHYTHLTFRNQHAGRLSASMLDSLRDNDKISLALTLYYLGEFMQGPVSDKMLDLINANMDMLRQSGLKCILRFAYTSNRNNEPWDAEAEVVLGHIEQLKPVLQKNSDVIAAMEAGFIGVWGEWYYSSHFGYPGPDWEQRAKVLEAMLDALPSDRMICLRTPVFKLNLMNIGLHEPLNAGNAHKQTSIARIGHHNDCFLASQDDYGTYKDIPNEKEYLEKDTRFVVMGGETCNPSDFSGCDNALSELERFHWSYLNRDYHRGVLGSWKTDSCYEEVVRRLGYRFSLEKGRFIVRPGSEKSLEIQLSLINEGYAAPYNPRVAEIILEHVSGYRHIAQMKDDPRFWLPGRHTLEGRISLPVDAPSGKYAVYLKLAPIEKSLYDNPFYSIRLANEGIWNVINGCNLLTEINLTN